MKTFDITVEMVAQLCHEANAEFCRLLGDFSQLAWDDLSDDFKLSSMTGVEFAIANPDATPEAQHEQWCRQKRENGWVYGEVKDAEKKTHPCLVPYKELPVEQQLKDRLFQGIVKAFTPSAAR